MAFDLKEAYKLAFNCETFEEFKIKAKEKNFKLTLDGAKKIFESVVNDKKKELNLDELDAVTGGCDPKDFYED